MELGQLLHHHQPKPKTPHPHYGGSMFDKVLHATSCALHDAGISTLRFNLRGAGRSEGRFEGGEGEAQDVRAAIDHAARDHDGVIVVGFSFGAWIGLRAGMDDPRVRGLVGLAMPVDVYDFSFLRLATKPLLLVHGDRDEWGAVANVTRVSGAGEHARLEVISGAGHSLAGRLDAVTAAVVDFCRGSVGSPLDGRGRSGA